ncbi:MAG: zinc-ribbon domain-containing protein [Clostridia bacterium]|nr:zinc-ribbon domain-containing protein [Clostridia bacterium]
MFCRHCGSPLADGSRFCSKCGAAVEIMPQAQNYEPVQQQYQPQTQPQYQPGFIPQPEQQFDRANIPADGVPVGAYAGFVNSAETPAPEADVQPAQFAESGEVTDAPVSGPEATGETPETPVFDLNAIEGEAAPEEEAVPVSAEPVDEFSPDPDADAIVFEQSTVADDQQIPDNSGVVQAPAYGYEQQYQNSPAPQSYQYNPYAYQNAPQNAPFKVKAKTNKRSGVAHGFSIFISLLLLLVLVLTAVVGVFQYYCSKNGAKNIIEDIDITNIKLDDILDKYTLSQLLRDSGLVNVNGNSSLVDFIYANIDQSLLEQEITREQLAEFLRSDVLNDFLAEKLSKLMTKTAEGEDTGIITVREIIDYISDKSNRRKIENILGYKIDDELIAELENVLNELLGKSLDGVRIEGYKDVVDESVSNIAKLLLSPVTLVVLGVVALLLVTLICIIIHSLRFGMLYNGIPFTLAGLLFLATYIVPVALGAFNSVIPIGAVTIVLSAVLKIFLFMGIGATVLGVALIVASIIVGSKQKKAVKAQ